jgi:ribosomal protein L11 methyltransferase
MGVEQIDGHDYVEYAIYGVPSELPSLPAGQANIAGVPVSVRADDVPDDWDERWMRFHHAVLIAGKIYIRPPWEPPAVRPGVCEVVIDPGQAFGTGTHPTTRLCCELLLELRAAGSVSDLGCGSGVLAITAAKLGFDPVCAYDVEQASLESTLKNARANGVCLAEIQRFDLRNRPVPYADTAVCNLTRTLLLRMASLMADVPKNMIVSGIFDSEVDEVAQAFAFCEVKREVTLAGWSALLLAPS